MLEMIRGGLGLLTGWSVALPFILLITVAAYTWYRTASTHTIMARIWQLFNGKTECGDPVIKQFLDEQFAFMQWRFTTGVPARTRLHAIEVINWTRANNEDVGAVAGCGNYFDLEKVTLRDENCLPKKRHLLARFALFIALFVTVVVPIVATFF